MQIEKTKDQEQGTMCLGVGSSGGRTDKRTEREREREDLFIFKKTK